MTGAPGLSAFALDDGVAYHTHSTYARGLEVLVGAIRCWTGAPFDATRATRPEVWMCRDDEYEATR